jgi:hypothetical protein
MGLNLADIAHVASVAAAISLSSCLSRRTSASPAFGLDQAAIEDDENPNGEASED